MTGDLTPDLVVNGEIVPAARVAAEAQHHPAPPGKPGVAWRAAARALALRTLLLQEARRRGLAAEPQAVGPGRRETEEEALIRVLLDAELDPAPPTEAEIEAEWARDPTRFRAPSLYEASHALFAAPPGDAAARAAAREKAEAAIALLGRRPEAFGDLARDESACASRANGGRLGQIVAADVEPAFAAALAALAEGAIASEPVETAHGLHVVRLDARADGAVLPYATARRFVQAALGKRAWAEAARAFGARLLADAEIAGVDFARVA